MFVFSLLWRYKVVISNNVNFDKQQQKWINEISYFGKMLHQQTKENKQGLLGVLPSFFI